MSEKKSMVVMAMVCSLFLVIGLALTACRSSLALGRAEQSPLSTPTVWPEWLPLPATDIWSVPPRPATPIPAEGRPRPTPLPVSPLPTPTPLPDHGVKVAGIQASRFSVRGESGLPLAQHLRIINPMIEKEILVGVVRESAEIWAVVAVDLFSGSGQILFEGHDFPHDPQIAGKYVIWTTLNGLYVYDVAQHLLEKLQQVGAAPWHAHISGNILVWEYLPNLLSADSDIWGYDLSKKESFPIVSLPGVQSGPLISDRWVLYLDSTDTQAVDWDKGLYAVHLDTGEVIRLGQVYGRWPHEVSQFYTLDVPWAAWSTGDWSDKPELYLYNLETRQAVTVTVTPCGASTAQPRRVENLAISGNIVIFTCGQPMGYDIEREAFFSIPVYATIPADGKWWGLGGWSIAGDRIVWVLSSEQESRIYTAQIERRP